MLFSGAYSESQIGSTYRAIDNDTFRINVRVDESCGGMQEHEAFAQLQDTFLDLDSTQRSSSSIVLGGLTSTSSSSTRGEY